ncbi:MAG: hypothetical protein M3Z25_18340 [Actinomycetota bacterium]|nr:hypothetical protein [Actinomycetota bacterium]
MTSLRSRRGLWAGLLAMFGVTAACAAGCVTPVVVAIGLLGGSGVLGAALGWLPAIAVLLVAAAVLVFFLPRRRSRCQHASGEQTECGCGPDREVARESGSTLRS